MRIVDRTRLLGAVCVLVLLAACQSTPTRQDASRPTAVLNASAELPEEQLLDVGIEVFEPGVLTEEDETERGLSEVVREAESRFIPVHLKQTMQRTGHWGAVRVLPAQSDSVDLLITGEIIESDGEELTLRVTAVDATGRQWLSGEYHAGAAEFAYDDARRGERDPFQNLYNTVANDLALAKADMSPEQLVAVRQISELRFAGDIAPDAFGGYVVDTEEGVSVASRLPAYGDPMMSRVRRVRERDYMLVDTVNGHYDAYYADLWSPYLSFRKFRAEEARELRELEAKARTRKAIGIAAFAGAIALDMLVGGNSSAAARNLLLVGGAASFKSGLDLSAQTDIHVDAMNELGTSFEAEAEPMLLDVEGETIRLTGSAEMQYATWRGMLQQIYLEETGIGGSLDVAPAGAVARADAPIVVDQGGARELSRMQTPSAVDQTGGRELSGVEAVPLPPLPEVSGARP